ncbi:general odorant-binding protein 99a [Scaptodrosophila lebanonensis]|uniref:General odorant-binding protein 99a n=1 Tax=Drosophila lebanonensis TaxID=7225 RepID=A0A6J2T677_DROLE|nr:general odorant-binding protein 99a [Scaptodrosophila lebanonensis]
MKYFLAAVALCAMTQADAEWVPKTAEQIKEIRAACLKEHALDDAQISKMKQLEFPDEPNVRQYLLCTATKLGIFCPSQGYHADRLAKQFKMDLSEEEALQIAQGCIDSNAEHSPADVWAFRGHKCMMASKIGDKVRAYIKAKEEAALKAKV